MSMKLLGQGNRGCGLRRRLALAVDLDAGCCLQEYGFQFEVQADEETLLRHLADLDSFIALRYDHDPASERASLAGTYGER
jgi:hypothetical protein